MSLLWIGAMTAFVQLEKLAPYGARGGRLSGAALLLAGVWVLASAQQGYAFDQCGTGVASVVGQLRAGGWSEQAACRGNTNR
jgi:hypothetical protein